jgi:valyl-tRNA synthetase
MENLKKEEMAPKYDHESVEKGKYEEWRKKGYFNSGDLSKKPYCVVIPPPNVTGKLHLGHAWDTTLQDILIRRKRMQGYDALWIPGMDHAGIATQAKVDAKLKAQGISRYDIGREKFLEVAWQWKKDYAETIHRQWAALGLSLDYQHERFTLDDGLQNAVKEVFIRLYQEGLIYRGERIINWDVEAKTALSNIEVIYKDIEGAFYHLVYPLVGEEGGLEVATTRPETMFGDSALMVNPEDPRYQKYIGKKVIIPFTNREIPVIADEYVDKEFGTGIVKVTPAHDPNDFEVGNRHNLPRIICMNEDGTMNSVAGSYEGMERFSCREKLVADLQKAGYCPKIEKMIHSVGHSERTGVIVEPRLSKQWFVKMEPLARDVLSMQDSNEPIEFVPNRFNKTLTSWLDLNNIQDWCISRQLWWGHRIPAWYRGEEVYVGKTAPSGDGWKQDEDVLDTWFSSALWPFSTLGWPESTKDLERYFPTDCLVTGYDIIFFWVARMAIQSKHFMGKRPFKTCFIHGLIRDEQGRKMSKSLGNGIDPFDLIKDYGCDAMRYFLTTNATPGQDLTFSQEKMASSWNYINKIWNISRYIQMNLEAHHYDSRAINPSKNTMIDRFILQRKNQLIQKVNEQYDNYDFGEVAHLIYNFTWDDFASWYLEFTKVSFTEGNEDEVQNTCAVLKEVLTAILQLLHPFMPFVTEEIYDHFYSESIMISKWPEASLSPVDETLEKEIQNLMDIITSVRNVRNEKNVALSKPIKLILEPTGYTLEETNHFVTEYKPYLTRFTNAQEIQVLQNVQKDSCSIRVIPCVNVVIPLMDLINFEDEIKKLKDSEQKLLAELDRSEKMLSNPNFISKAPQQKVAMEKEKQEKYRQQLNEVQENMKKLEALK